MWAGIAVAFSIAAVHRFSTMREPSDRIILALYGGIATFFWIVYLGN
jgi:hypothetical protein